MKSDAPKVLRTNTHVFAAVFMDGSTCNESDLTPVQVRDATLIITKEADEYRVWKDTVGVPGRTVLSVEVPTLIAFRSGYRHGLVEGRSERSWDL